MKKLIVSIFTVLCLLTTPLTAMEWGGLIFNDSGISTPDFSDITFKQSDGVSFWLKSPLGADSGFIFSSEVIYKFNLEIAKDSDPAFTQIFDVPLLKVSGDINAGAGLLSLNAGRFYYVDGSSAVISQVVDGVSVSYGLPLVNIGGFVGYTGLLNGLNVSMAVPSEKDNKIYNLAYPYVPVGAFFELPSLAGNQSLEIDAYYILDTGSIKNDLFYANLLLSGPIANSVYYNAAASLGLINFKDMMLYSSASLLIFPSPAVSVNAGVTFGSAADQGSFVAFTSLSPAALAAAGKITPKVAFTYTTKNLCFDLGGDFVLLYDGSKYASSTTDWNVGVIYNIFSDLQVGLTADASIDLTDAKAHNYGAKLNISLAF